MSNSSKRYSLNLQMQSQPWNALEHMSSSPDLTRHVSSSFYKLRSLDYPSSSRNSMNDVDPSLISNCKLLLIGDANVGKTATILSYCNELMTRGQLNKLEEAKAQTKINNIVTSPIRTASMKLLERKRQQVNNLSNEKETKRYSLTDFEELSKRQSLIFYPSTTSPTSPSIRQPSRRQVSENLDQSSKRSPFLDTNDSIDTIDENEIIIQTRSTIGVDIKTRLVNVDNRYFNCIFWDTAGQERFQNAIIPSLYKNCNGIILTYDICDYKSFEDCFDNWLVEALKNLTTRDLQNSRFYLVGNKIDLYENRQVKHEDVLKKISNTEEKYGVTIYGNFEVSCKWSHTVDKVFNTIILNLIENCCYEDNTKKYEANDNLEDSRYHAPIISSSQENDLGDMMSDLDEEANSSDNDSLYSAEDKIIVPKLRNRKQPHPSPRQDTIDITKPANNDGTVPEISSSCCS